MGIKLTKSNAFDSICIIKKQSKRQSRKLSVLWFPPLKVQMSIIYFLWTGCHNSAFNSWQVLKNSSITIWGLRDPFIEKNPFSREIEEWFLRNQIKNRVYHRIKLSASWKMRVRLVVNKGGILKTAKRSSGNITSHLGLCATFSKEVRAHKQDWTVTLRRKEKNCFTKTGC